MPEDLSYKNADELACRECVRLNCDIYIYRLKNGKFRVTSEKKSIPLTASIHNIIAGATPISPKQPITVACPICQSPAGIPCSRIGMNVAPWAGEMHVDRVHEARVADELGAGKAVA